MKRTKSTFINKIIVAFDGVVMRFYEQIISGVWSLSLLIPIDRIVEYRYLDHSTCIVFEKPLIFICFFVIATVIFLGSAIIIPRIHTTDLRIEIRNLWRSQIITASQKRKITTILRDTIVCRSFFSREGFWQFIMQTIFNFAIIAFYFAFENYLLFISGSKGHLSTSIVFFIIFVIAMCMEWLLDKLFTAKMLIPQIEHLNSDNFRHTNKTILLRMMSIIGRDSFRSSMSQIMFEDAIDDIIGILNLTNDKKHGTQGTN